jgi:hypothetical protein
VLQEPEAIIVTHLSIAVTPYKYQGIIRNEKKTVLFVNA